MKELKRLMIVLFIALSIYAAFTRINEKQINYIEAEYTVQAGDTLWSIAEENANECQDLREYVYQLKQANNIDSTLEVGQNIIIFK